MSEQKHMSLPITICDDSGFARNAMARALPDEWDVDISFAENGKVAIERINSGLAHLLFLDLNMPVMDGYETLKAIREHDLSTMVIVVSGDVQPEARKRVQEMGAIDFIEKPIKNEKLISILKKYGIYDGESSSNNRRSSIHTGHTLDDKIDVFREMSNVAMGKAGQSLASLLNVFVELPVPNVSLVHSNEIAMAVHEIDRNDQVSAVSKGFVGDGIRGEAIILFNKTNSQNMKALLGYEKNQTSDLEVLMDVSNVIVGACLNGIANQLKLAFTHTTPIILGLQCGMKEIVDIKLANNDEILLVEIAYVVSSANVNFELLLLLPKNNLDLVHEKLLNIGESVNA